MKIVNSGLKRFLLFLAISILIYPGVLSAGSKKHGTKVKVIKTSGQIVVGELLQVKEDGLVLMSNSESQVRVPMEEINAVKVKGRGSFLAGAAVGIGICIVIFGVNELRYPDDDFWERGMLFMEIFGGPMSLICGGLNMLTINYKTHKFQDAKPAKRARIIEKLKSHARF